MQITTMTRQVGPGQTSGRPAQQGKGHLFKWAYGLVTVSCLLGSGSSLSYAGAQTTPSQPQSNPADSVQDTPTRPCCPQDAGDLANEQTATSTTGAVRVPDVELIDQDGQKVRFYSDLVKGKVVAMNFIFTTCTTVCPSLTANFAQVQALLSDRADHDVNMISISIDPVTDTPQRLKAWSKKFSARPGWTFLTGKKKAVDTLLKALRVFTVLKEDHAPILLIGNESNSQWTRVNGLAPPADVVQVIQEAIGQAGGQAGDAPLTQKTATDITEKSDPAAKKSSHSKESSLDTAADVYDNEPAHNYFSDVQLINQHGQPMRLYSDLLRGKSVVMSCFFTECTGVCPVVNKNMQAIQDALGDRVGKDVLMISISVDPVTDTPQRLASYAQQYEAKPGWYFLTGKKENVEYALSRLGYSVETREQHSNIIIVGNDRTGLWKKAFSLAKGEQLIQIVKQVVDDGV